MYLCMYLCMYACIRRHIYIYIYIYHYTGLQGCTIVIVHFDMPQQPLTSRAFHNQETETYAYIHASKRRQAMFLLWRFHTETQTQDSDDTNVRDRHTHVMVSICSPAPVISLSCMPWYACIYASCKPLDLLTDSSVLAASQLCAPSKNPPSTATLPSRAQCRPCAVALPVCMYIHV